jgi:hypothetical protein
MANHCVRAAGLRCAGPVLQLAWPHVSLVAFNGLPAAHLAGARRRPCHVARSKIRMSAPMEIKMVGSAGDICFYFNCSQPVEPTPGPRGSSRAALRREAEAIAQGTCGGPGAPLSREAGAGTTGHMGMHAHLYFRLNLEHVQEGVRSSGYRQWPPGPPRERLRTHGWGQHPFPCSLFEFCTS